MKSISIQQVEYGHWPNCYRLANDFMELIVTTDVGPRVIRCGFTGGENEFKEYTDQLGLMGGSDWRIYGGHRLWHAPEDKERTYQPDNGPVKFEYGDNTLRLVQPVETATGIQKEMEVRLAPEIARATIVHRLRNAGSAPVVLAPWALSVMAPGGTAVVPLPPRGSHPEDLPAASSLILWKYTDMTDPRWTWGRQFILLRQDATRGIKPQKIGATVPDGWMAYARANNLFVKTFRYQPGAPYPDLGCSIETFTNNEMLELETLGPITELAPGAVVEHVEEWWLFRNVPMPRQDVDVTTHILPLVRTSRH